MGHERQTLGGRAGMMGADAGAGGGGLVMSQSHLGGGGGLTAALDPI